MYPVCMQEGFLESAEHFSLKLLQEKPRTSLQFHSFVLIYKPALKGEEELQLNLFV